MIYLYVSTLKMEPKFKGFNSLTSLLAATGASIRTPQYHDQVSEIPGEQIWLITYPWVNSERWYGYIVEVLEMLSSFGARIEGTFGLHGNNPVKVNTVENKIVQKEIMMYESQNEEITNLAKSLKEELGWIYAYDSKIIIPMKSLLT